ncbi:hypothetical protein BDQ17DRAFT_1326165 [Cyathus striatus]|nr:hypothetical protein BDQ17DRAFT_1326165 [Cyathus striatus]
MHPGLVGRLFLVAAVVFGVKESMGLEERYNGGHVARQDPTSPSSTSSSPATTSPIISFDDVSELTACSSGIISWFYAGPSASMRLFVSNVSVAQGNPPASSTSLASNTFTNGGIVAAVPTGAVVPDGDGITFTLSTSIDPSSESFTWSSVNVSQGWYTLYALIPSYAYIQQSPVFFVQQGSDTSCISGTSTSGPTSTGVSSISSSHLSTSSSLAASSSSVAAPVGGASSTSSPKVGVIVGVVVGGTALLVAVVLAYFCLQRKGKGLAFRKGGSAGSRGWGGLGSVDNIRSTEGSKRVYAGGRSNSQADSVGPIVTGSEEAFSPSVEKFSSTSTPGHGHSVAASPFDDSVGAVFSTLPGLGRNGSTNAGKRGASRTYSYSSTMNSHGAYTTNDYTPNSSRRPSMPESVSLPSGAARPSLDSNTYPPPSPAYPSGTSAILSPSITAQPHYYNPYINPELARSQSYTLSSSSNVQGSSSQVQIPTSPKSGMSPGTTSSRKTPRKPVPIYDPASVVLQQSTVSLPVSASERSPAESTASHEFFNVVGGSQGHYTTRTNSQPGVRREPNLQHKSSFGPGGVEGKPMHLLIPDMPLNLKD